MTNNTGLNNANKAKQDEFYTQLPEIEKELRHYKDFFKGKIVFCNCDDPENSNFWKFFELNFEHLGFKKLIATHFETNKPSYKLELTTDITGDGKIDKADIVKTPLKQNGDFRSSECIEILKEADVVVSNPPFSLFREYVAQLVEYDKKFLIIGNVNAISYKEIFKLIKDNKIWLGASIHSGDREFMVPEHYIIHSPSRRVDENGVQYVRISGVRWFTNLDYKERHEDLILYKTYYGNEKEYPKLDGSEIINVDKVVDIPIDVNSILAVPLTFLDKYNPSQFQLIGLMASTTINDFNFGYPFINGKKKYARILIKKI
jgi:hypothetical protein